jgi:uncharacterized protein (DUF2062 family)
MDRYPAKPILLAALGIFGCILFLLVGLGAAGLALYTLHVVQQVGPLTVGVLAGCTCAALFCFALTYFTARATLRRLKEANAEATARRNALGL